MAKGLIKKTIDGKTYEFSQFGASHALKLGTRLIKIIGEPLALAMGNVNKARNILDQEIPADTLSKAVRALVERLDEGEVDYIVKELAADSVMCEGRKIIFDLHYQGEFAHLFKVLAAALEVQYGNFFGAGFGKSHTAQPEQVTPLQSIQAL